VPTGPKPPPSPPTPLSRSPGRGLLTARSRVPGGSAGGRNGAPSESHCGAPRSGYLQRKSGGIRWGAVSFGLRRDVRCHPAAAPAEYPLNGGRGSANENPLRWHNTVDGCARAHLDRPSAGSRQRTIHADRAAAAPPVPPTPSRRSPGRGLGGRRDRGVGGLRWKAERSRFGAPPCGVSRERRSA
jgi:hypothetical protein